MHSSRMRTGRSLTVCCNVLPGEGGVSLVPGGLPGPGGGVLLGPGGVLLGPGGGVLLGPGGGSPWSRGGSPETPLPPVNRITDTCKNITLATTSLRPVTNDHQVNPCHTSYKATTRQGSGIFAAEEFCNSSSSWFFWSCMVLTK